MKYWLSLIIVLVLFSIGTTQSNIENTEISILTADSGDELYSTFGHTALRINNRAQGVDQVYNYGIFDFNTEGFYIKFMRGLLPYRLGVNAYANFLQQYHYEQRTIWEQKLNLTNDQKEFIIQFLRENLKPENVEYPYDFFFDNCTTRVYDISEELGEVTYTDEISEKTFRDMLKENLKAMPWTEFGIDLVIGARADKTTDRAQQMFLPMYFHDQLNNTELNGQPMITSDYLVLDFIEEGSKRKESSTPWPLIVFGLLFIMRLGASLIVRDSKGIEVFDKIFVFLVVVMSILMSFMWFGTAHQATNDNWNLLWASPLFLVWYWLKDNKIYLFILLGLLVIAGFNCIFQFLPQFYHLAFLPIIGVLILIVVKEILLGVKLKR